ncbi:hypothetical protein CTI12_AA477210 [Artemisia annua]|uniref:Uncharacterized protein n=1 Tax=Artemisia annua TaxID=35608 RepID=A0A2U1LLN9_ARTAN|nr:hypothetical protein CTI12_AA477210 [Artemisia annua]
MAGVTPSMNNQFDKGGTTGMAALVQTPRQNTAALKRFINKRFHKGRTTAMPAFVLTLRQYTAALKPLTISVTWSATKRNPITSLIGRYNQIFKTTNINYEVTYSLTSRKAYTND